MLAGAVLLPISASAQTTVIEENFDSYADTAALNGVWTEDSAGYTLMTDGGHSGANYVRTGTTAAGRLSHAINVTATDDAPVEASFWTRVSGTSSGRSYLQLDLSASWRYIAYGQYNNPGGGVWNLRVSNGDTTGDWAATTVDQVADTWTHLKIIIEKNRARFYVNDVQVYEETRATDMQEITAVRLGFAGSSVISVDYDDLLIRQVSSVNDWNLY